MTKSRASANNKSPDTTPIIQPTLDKRSKKTPELINSILHDISTTTISIRKICENNGINTDTWYTWMYADKEITERYARAKQDQADVLAAEIIEIADECMYGERIKTKGDGSMETISGDMVERSKLRVDARKWVAAKLLPKKYGDRVAVEHSGDVVLSERLSAARKRLSGKEDVNE